MVNPFNKISVKQKEKLLKRLESVTFEFKRNTPILSTVKNEEFIAIIISGSVQIIKTDYYGNRTIIEELQENAMFGSKISSLTNKEYDVITMDDTKIIIIDYFKIINESDLSIPYYNQFVKNLLEIVIDVMGEKNERIEILTKRSIRNKLLEYFNIVSKKHNSKNIYLPFSFTDLADYLAIDRSAMSRELKYLKEEGFIEIKAKRITLLY